MSRDIKFRIWHKADKQMYIVYNLAFSDEFNEPLEYDSVQIRRNDVWEWVQYDDFILLQYTGLKDKNNKDLDWWEDDLLRKGSAHPNAPIAIITYHERDAEWIIASKSGAKHCNLLHADENGWGKIGNVHQDPKLLEADE